MTPPIVDGVRGPVHPALRWVWRLEDSLLVALLLGMIGLAVTQILLRNGFDSGINWADGAVRTLVLWVAMVGSMIAARRRQHIRIDALLRYLPERPARLVLRLTDLITASICLAMAWYGLQLVRLEYADGFTAFGDVPAWLTESIIPFAFSVLGLRYLLQAFLPGAKAPVGGPAGPALAAAAEEGVDPSGSPGAPS